MKISNFLLTSILTLFIYGLSIAQETNVQYTATSPAIDGQKEDIWDVANVVTLDNFELGSTDSTDLHAQFSTLWSADTTLHVLIEVTDNSTYLTNAWSSGDFVQVNIDLNNDDAEQYLFDDMFWMIRPSWNDSTLVGRYGPNWEGLSQIPWYSTMDESNYIIELSIPMNDLDVSAFYGNRTSIGFDIKVTDGDINGQDTIVKESEVVWVTGASWNDPSQMGTLILTGKPLAPTISMAEYVEDAPTIDGEKESMWDNAEVTLLENLETGNGDTKDLVGQFSTLWTAHDTTLYVLIEVQDDSTFLTNAWSSGDFVQVNVDLDNDDAEQYLFDDMFWMIRPSWNDSTLVGRYGPNWEGLSQIPWYSAMDDSNYIIELALPLSDLGISEFHGNRTSIGFDIKVTDGEIVGTDTLMKKNELVWSSGASWNNPSQMGTLILNGKPIPPAETIAQHVENAPEIDGEIDAMWDDASTTILENVEMGTPDIKDLSAQFRTLWNINDTTMYVLIEVEDDNTFLTNAWSSGDFVQLNVDLDNDDTDQYLFDDMFWMIRPSWNDSTLVGRNGPNWDDLPEIPWYSSMDGSNYIIEVALPLSDLGISTFDGNGTNIGFDIKVTDGDIVGVDTLAKENEIVWSSGESWNNPSAMGNIELLGAPVQSNTAQNDMNQDITFYPNPVKDQLNIQTPAPNSKMMIYNITGELISSHYLESSMSTIDVSDLGSGIYIIGVKTDKGNIIYQKMLKKQ